MGRFQVQKLSDFEICLLAFNFKLLLPSSFSKIFADFKSDVSLIFITLLDKLQALHLYNTLLKTGKLQTILSLSFIMVSSLSFSLQDVYHFLLHHLFYLLELLIRQVLKNFMQPPSLTFSPHTFNFLSFLVTSYRTPCSIFQFTNSFTLLQCLLCYVVYLPRHSFS